METKDILIITPKTKVLQLIETYPQLEVLLIEMVPVFEKLKNPVLRKTIAKVATLQQAAAIGNVKAEELINALRKAVGQDKVEVLEGTSYVSKQPDWFAASKVVREFDIREMLDAGEQPLNQAVSDLSRLKTGEIYQLTSPFLPAPLIEKASSLNIQHWVSAETKGVFIVYFVKL